MCECVRALLCVILHTHMFQSDNQYENRSQMSMTSDVEDNVGSISSNVVAIVPSLVLTSIAICSLIIASKVCDISCRFGSKTGDGKIS